MTSTARLGTLEREVLRAILDVREEAKPPTKSLAAALEELRLMAAQAEAVTSPGTQAYENAVAALSHRKPGRTGVKPGEAALIDVRTRIWGKDVTPAQRAALSRSLRTLEAKGLIRCGGHRRFIVRLTPEGELNVNKDAKATLLTPQGVAP